MDKNKKGQVQGAIYQLIFLAIGLVVVGTITVFGANFIDQNDNSFTAGSYAANASQQSLSALNDVAEGQGTVTTVGILAVVIGLLLGVVALFGFMRGRNQ